MKKFRKKIAIIGANEYQNKLILKAKDLGLETHVFSWGKNEIGQKTADFFYEYDVTKVEEIAKKCEELCIDGVCSIASDLTNLTVNFIRKRLGFNRNSEQCIEVTTNKYSMRDALESGGSPVPRYYLFDKEKKASKLTNFPYIVKPVDRSGSRGVTLVESPCEFDFAVTKSIKESFVSQAIVEEYVDGKEYSIESFSDNGVHHILQVTEKFTSESPNFIETAHIAPAVLDENKIREIKSIVSNALTNLNVNFGASHSEIKINSNRDIKIIEVGSRMGGDFIGSDLVYLNTKVDFLKLELLSALQIDIDPLELNPEKNDTQTACVIFSFSQKHFESVAKLLKNDLIDYGINQNFSGNVQSSNERYGYHLTKIANNKLKSIIEIIRNDTV